MLRGHGARAFAASPPSLRPGCRKISLEALEAWGKRAYRPRQTGPVQGSTPSRASERTESGTEMKFGDIARKWLHVLPLVAAILALTSISEAGLAQAPAASVADAAVASVADEASAPEGAAGAEAAG